VARVPITSSAPGASSRTTDAYGPKGYLAEGARTNLCLQSQTFGTTWTVDATAVSADQYTAPDGTTTVDKITANAGNSTHGIYQGSITWTATPYTFSCYARYVASQRWISLRMYGATNDKYASFDLLNGVVGAVTSNTTSTITETNIAGVYRCTMTITPAAEAGLVAVYLNSSDSASAQVWNAAGTEAVGLWGAQLEAASFASSYIPTTTVAVARNADLLRYAASGNVVGTVGTAYAEFQPMSATLVTRVLQDADTSKWYLQYNAGPLRIWDGSTATGTANSLSTTAVNKIASSWSNAPNEKQAVLSGGTVATGTFNSPMQTSATIGVSDDQQGGTTRNLQIYGVAKTAAQLQAMTS
jgi:hypothetical protein